MADESMQALKVALDAHGVLQVTLNRPEAKNALSPGMADELEQVFGAARTDPEVKVVVLSGADGNFCSGGDVKQMGESAARSPEQRYHAMQRYRRLTADILAFDRPVLSVVDGVAYGAGFGLALLGDMLIVSDRVRLSMVFGRIGLVPDLGAYYTLPRVVGLQKAKELVFSAREIGAEEAVRLGLAMEAVPAAQLQARALEVARSFCGASSTALRMAKQALNLSLHSDLASMLELEATGQAIAGDSAYSREAVRRFRAKEPPQFTWPKSAS